MERAIRTFSNDPELVKERREHIRKCTTALFVKQSFHETNMRQIEEACGMSRGALYQYVGSKEDIRTIIIEHAIRAGNAGIDRRAQLLEQLGPTRALKDTIRQIFAGIDSMRDEYIFLNHEVKNLPREVRQALYETESGSIESVEKILWSGVESGEFKLDNTNLVAHIIVTAGHDWAIRRWYLRERYTLKEYTEEFTRLIFKLVGVDTARS